MLLKFDFQSGEAMRRMSAAEAGEEAEDCLENEDAEIKAADNANSHASENPGALPDGGVGDGEDAQQDGGLQYLGLSTIARQISPFFEAGLGCGFSV